MARDGEAEAAAGSRFGFHRRGPPSRSRTYVGFALFLTGVFLGLLGLLLFLWSATTAPAGSRFWLVREVAIVLPAIGLAAFLLGIVLVLPVGNRPVSGAIAGGLVCMTAVGVFIWAYPDQWDVVRFRGYSRLGIGLYAGGLTILTASNGVGLRNLTRGAPARATQDRSTGRYRRKAGGHSGQNEPPDANPDVRPRADADPSERMGVTSVENDCLSELFREYEAETEGDR